MSKAKEVKLVVVGSTGSGKTSLLISYVKGSFPEEWVPTVFENYTKRIIDDDRIIELHLWDTNGDPTYDKLRALSYDRANMFLICFSLADRESLENVKEKWYPEIQEYSTGTPVILVGTKLDLRDESLGYENSDQSTITRIEAEKVAKELEYCQGYYECSAKTLVGMEEVFQAGYAERTHRNVTEFVRGRFHHFLILFGIGFACVLSPFALLILFVVLIAMSVLWVEFS